MTRVLASPSLRKSAAAPTTPPNVVTITQWHLHQAAAYGECILDVATGGHCVEFTAEIAGKHYWIPMAARLIRRLYDRTKFNLLTVEHRQQYLNDLRKHLPVTVTFPPLPE